MEEFIREHEKEFLDYIELEENNTKQLEELRTSKSTMEEEVQIITNNEDRNTDFDSEIKERGNRIEEIKRRIMAINIEKSHWDMQKTISELEEDSEKREVDLFNNNVKILELEKEEEDLKKEIENLKCEKKELEQRAEKVKRDNKKLKEYQKNIRSAKKKIEKLERELEERRSALNEIIEDKTKSKKEALEAIPKNKEDNEKKLEKEIKSKERAISEISKEVYEDEKLKKYQNDTIERLKNELESLKERLKVITNDFNESERVNSEEYHELKKLKESLYSGNIKGLLKPILKTTYKQPENSKSEYSDTGLILAEDLDKIYEEEFSKEIKYLQEEPEYNNQEEQNKEDEDTKSSEEIEEKEQPNNDNVKIEEKKNIIKTIKEKFLNMLNKAKLIISEFVEVWKEDMGISEEDFGEPLNCLKEENDFKEELAVDNTKNKIEANAIEKTMSDDKSRGTVNVQLR